MEGGGFGSGNLLGWVGRFWERWFNGGMGKEWEGNEMVGIMGGWDDGRLNEKLGVLGEGGKGERFGLGHGFGGTDPFAGSSGSWHCGIWEARNGVGWSSLI